MSRGMTRANRLKEMERLYLDRAFSDIEEFYRAPYYWEPHCSHRYAMMKIR